MSLAYTAPAAANALTEVSIGVGDLLRRLDTLMVDADRVRWDLAERIDWINDAAREIVLRRPAARAVTEQVALNEGTYQQAAQGTSQILDIVCNVTIAGKRGRAITIADRQALDGADPDWHAMKTGVTRHYMLDERSPTAFYVYPPAINGALIEMLVAAAPPKVTAAADRLDMRAEFINAVVNWCLYRCHTKDSEFAQGSISMAHYQAFTDAIGAPAQAAQVNSANGNSV